MSGDGGSLSFNGFRLDFEKGVLERHGEVVPLRPKSFALLSFFARNPGRVLAKEELLDAVWKRIAVTDDALTQTIKDVRRAIADAGAETLRTVPKRGYLFAPRSSGESVEATGQLQLLASSDRDSVYRVLERMVEESMSSRPFPPERGGSERQGNDPQAVGGDRGATRVSGRSRPAIAILPLAVEVMQAADDHAAHLRDGLLRDIVRELSRLRGVVVIAAGSSKVMEGNVAEPLEAGRLLRVDYITSGSLSQKGKVLHLDIELIAVADGRALLAESFSRPLAGAAQIGSELAAEVARAVAAEVDLAERNLAALMPAQELDAWQAYHRGLWHMHRFTGADNLDAARFFEQSIALDPTFARPYAGLSFTHFLKAWLLDPTTQTVESSTAHDLAVRAVTVDPHDPSAHAALGRALWLRGAIDEAAEALQRSTAISPNFAFGHYATGFVEGFSGDPSEAIKAIDNARELSPFDPFLAPIHAMRAIALLRLGRLEEAGAWGSRAVRQPNAHMHVLRTAVICMMAAGRIEEAAPLVRTINSDSPDNGGEAFIKGMRLKPPDEKLFRELTRQSGLL